ncbi:DUF4825 domain-containing protein [Alicyclobacillus curvatus]|nr:DUF4825 domain-containing protein [Alicyclobacillus curvatus]
MLHQAKWRLVPLLVVATLTIVGCSTNQGTGQSSGQSPVQNPGQGSGQSSGQSSGQGTNSALQRTGFLKYEGSYVGDNSAVGQILSMLPAHNYVDKFSLQTEHKPYGITVYYRPGQSGVNAYDQFWNGNKPDVLMAKNAAVLFSLVQNADVIHFDVQDVSTYTFTRADVQQKYGDLSKLFHDDSSFTKFLNS